LAAWILGAGNTAFGKLPREDTLSLMAGATEAALLDAKRTRRDIDAVLCGYSTTFPHPMLASAFAEHFGLTPTYCHAVHTGGSSAAAMVMLAKRLVDAGQCRNVLIVGGENRATGANRGSKLETLASAGHADFEAPFGPTVPAYFALVASRYMHEFGYSSRDLAVFAVLMRDYASRHPDAHYRATISVEDVLASRPIAEPFRLLDCCPMSDGGAALVISDRPGEAPVSLAGAAQAHPHQHVIAMRSFVEFGGKTALEAALREAGADREELDICALYDSFTATLLIFLEDLGLVARGEAAQACRRGDFGRQGRLPLNTHGGLLSFGHSGVAGGMNHLIEVYRQLAGKAQDRQLGRRNLGLVHAEGGIFSTQVSLILRRVE